MAAGPAPIVIGVAVVAGAPDRDAVGPPALEGDTPLCAHALFDLIAVAGGGAQSGVHGTVGEV